MTKNRETQGKTVRVGRSAIWMAAPSIPDLAQVYPQQQKTAITNEANK